MTQLVKNPPAMWETWIWSLGWEDPLEKGTATHSSVLGWRIPWTVQSRGSQRVGHTERLSLFFLNICCGKSWASLIAQLVKNLPAMQETCLILGSGRSPGEGIGYTLQYSWATLVVQMVKNPPAIRETWVWSLGREDILEEGMVTHSSILA